MQSRSSPGYLGSYLSEVLGVKNYLCPESIYALRSVKGGLPCRVLAVVFKPPSSSQRFLLKKIMSSINILDYSLLEIRNPIVLNHLLSNRERLADFVLFFGGPDLREKFPAEQSHFYMLSDRESSVQKLENPTSGSPPALSRQNPMSSAGAPVSFFQVYSLEELEGKSIEVINRKKQLWLELKKWKQAMGI